MGGYVELIVHTDPLFVLKYRRGGHLSGVWCALVFGVQSWLSSWCLNDLVVHVLDCISRIMLCALFPTFAMLWFWTVFSYAFPRWRSDLPDLSSSGILLGRRQELCYLGWYVWIDSLHWLPSLQILSPLLNDQTMKSGFVHYVAARRLTTVPLAKWQQCNEW